MMRCSILLLFFFATSSATRIEASEAPTAQELIAGVIDLTRGQTSYAEFSMVIHRPDWERASKLVAWTRGREDALIRFTAPTKDAGNATLKQGQQMWTFTPKLNRVIRLPFSMMSQGWAGSDFSYSDLSRTDQLLHDYELSLVGNETRDGHQVYTVDAVPHDDAPVVWGKEQIVLRDDYVLLGQTFFDQAMKPLKRLESLRDQDARRTHLRHAHADGAARQNRRMDRDRVRPGAIRHQDRRRHVHGVRVAVGPQPMKR